MFYRNKRNNVDNNRLNNNPWAIHFNLRLKRCPPYKIHKRHNLKIKQRRYLNLPINLQWGNKQTYMSDKLPDINSQEFMGTFQNNYSNTELEEEKSNIMYNPNKSKQFNQPINQQHTFQSNIIYNSNKRRQFDRPNRKRRQSNQPTKPQYTFQPNRKRKRLEENNDEYTNMEDEYCRRTKRFCKNDPIRDYDNDDYWIKKYECHAHNDDYSICNIYGCGGVTKSQYDKIKVRSYSYLI